jgi:molybdate transport system substrate-binding protein
MLSAPRRIAAVTALVLSTLALTACGAADTARTRLTVYAAASLQSAFDDLAGAFLEEHPQIYGVEVVVDGSHTLATQLIAGAPADVFASADEPTMLRMVEAALVADDAPVLFASNSLVIAVPLGNPAGVQTPDDLARRDLVFVQCAREAPCGAIAEQQLAAWGVAPTPASYEQNVTAVLTKVGASEADAGLVYRSDLHERDDVETVAVDGGEHIATRYPIAALASAAQPDAASAFVAFVTNETGREILARHGFGAP